MDSKNRLLKCRACGTLNEVETLGSRPVPGTVNMQFGYSCSKCGSWELCYFLSPILFRKAGELAKISTKKPKYARLFAKFKVSFDNLQKEMVGLDGSREHKDLVKFGQVGGDNRRPPITF